VVEFGRYFMKAPIQGSNLPRITLIESEGCHICPKKVEPGVDASIKQLVAALATPIFGWRKKCSTRI